MSIYAYDDDRVIRPQCTWTFDALAAENERLRERVETQERVIATNVREYQNLEAEVERLRAALKRYGQHDFWKCASVRIQTDDNDVDTGVRAACSCGFDDALEGKP